MFHRVKWSLLMWQRVSPVVRWGLTVAVLGLLLSWVTNAVHGDEAQEVQESIALELGKPVQRDLKGGQAHSYKIALESGQYLRIVIDQRGIDIVPELFSPDITKLAGDNNIGGPAGLEVVSFIAEVSGSYRLEIRPFRNEAAIGRYEVKIEEQHPATAKDRVRIAAEKIMIGGYRLQNQQMAEPLRQAITKYEEALLLWREIGDRKEELKVLDYFSRIYQWLGDKQRAMDYSQQAILLARDMSDHYREANLYMVLAAIHSELGDKQKALDGYNKARQIFRDQSAKYGEALAINKIGTTYQSLGDTQKALECYQQALPVFASLGDRSSEAQALNNIGVAYFYLNDRQKGLDYCNQALSLARKHDRQSVEALALSNVAYIYQAMGEKQRGLDYDLQVLRISQALGDRKAEALALKGVGDAVYRIGDFEKAKTYLNQALEILQSVTDRYKEGSTFYSLARANYSLGNLIEARKQIEAAISSRESMRARIVHQELRESFFVSVQDDFDLYISLLMQLHRNHPVEGHDTDAFKASESARARSLLELLSEANADIRQGVDPALLELERSLQQRLNAKAEARTRLLSNKRTEAQAAAFDKEIAELTSRYQEVKAQIRATSPRYAALTQPLPLSASEIQQQVLDSDTLLLEYALGEKQSYLWAVTPTSLASYQLPPRKEIEAAANRVYEMLTARQPKPGLTQAQQQTREAEAEANYWPQAAALSQMLLGQVASQLGNKRLLIVAPGALQYVPFAALPAPKDQSGGIKNEKAAQAHVPLMMEHEIVSLPSASVLAVLRRETAGRRAAPKTVAVIADPVFEPDDPRIKSAFANRQARQNDLAARQAAEPQNESLPTDFERAVRSLKGSGDRAYLARLPHTRKEADAIFALTPAGAGMKSLDFQANRATAGSGDLSQYRIVHYAAHGLLNSEQPELSGLVLSLVDEAGRPQDGFLRLHDIYNLRLNADLVVLSACQTALGKNVKGEGLVGLTRGFMYAGAQRVVASLWQVNDAATADLMKRFYQGMLRDGKRPAAALRDAQIEMWKRKSTQAPYYWAAFILQGEWR